MYSIDSILKPYIELESSVRLLMTQLFSETCGMCTACCCRADICEEATGSAFLSRLLERQELFVDNMDDRYGWLDLDGCSLDYGRPPVCYTYFCDELLARLPDDDARHTARVLGRLMDHVGKDALGDWHLVEIMDPDDLGMIAPEDILLRLEESRAALDVVEEYMHTGRLTATGLEILARISLDDED
ncbi:MAG: hypothetical protein DRP64_20745 [Verrucomicrobia bacterium]|nr:MAG: hypothetical protein DRP64_20745 [Verrucomicrobiota bacterium]